MVVGRDLTVGGERMIRCADYGYRLVHLKPVCMVSLTVTPKFYLKSFKIKKRK